MDLKQYDEFLHDAEVKLKRLKALYEQWFAGIERAEPTVPKKDLDRMFAIMHKEKPRNTAARFRFQQLQARYNTYLTYWGRIARQIEEGTYERDLRRVRRRRNGAPVERERVEQKEYELDLDVDIDAGSDLFGEDEISSVLSALEEARASRPPSLAPKGGLSSFSPFAKLGKSNPQKSDDATSPGTPNPLMASGARPPVSFKEGALVDRGAKGDALREEKTSPNAQSPTVAKAPVTATFGRPAGPRPATPSPPSGTRRLDSPAANRPAAASATNGSPGPARPSPPRPPTAPGAEPPMKRIYDQYLAAKQRNNERVDNVDYDKLAQSVEQMTSKLRQKHGNKKIDFEVVVQNGRVGLKPKIQ
jgi:hypothetical protein